MFFFKSTLLLVDLVQVIKFNLLRLKYKTSKHKSNIQDNLVQILTCFANKTAVLFDLYREEVYRWRSCSAP